MKLKKIIFILPSLKSGGGTRVIIELANQLITQNINVDIIYPNNSQDGHTFHISEKIKIVPIGKYHKHSFFKLINLFRTFYYIHKTYKNNILIFTDPIVSIFTPIILNNHIIRFIQSDDYAIFDDRYILKNNFLLYLYKIFTRLSYHYKITYIFNSQFTFNRFQELSKRTNIPLKLVHPAINHDIFFNLQIRSTEHINICIVARKHPLKGFSDFLTAFKNIKQHIKINNIFILSHDDLSDFDLTGMQLIKPKDDHEIAYYMNLSHIFISTSWWEGFGLPPLEAMSCGCSVILTDAKGVNEYAISKKNCLMYQPQNIKTLQKYILLLTQNSSLRYSLAQNAQDKATEFSWNKSTHQLIKVLHDVN